MAEHPVRKLNKRLIYWCLLGLVALSVPALVSLASSSKKTDQNEASKQTKAQPNTYAHDAMAITGTENFPETYGDVKDFEKELAKANKKEAPAIEDSLFQAEEMNTEKVPRRESFSYGYGAHNDDPWHEARKRDEKQRAFDRYDAKRSDIMFVNNIRNKREESLPSDSDEEMLKMMDKAMAMAEQNSATPGDMLLIKSGETKDPYKSFLDKRGIVGQINNPSRFMVSEGTLINAILLSEINTDLPGPILARVSHNIWDSKTGQTLLIPQNSKLIGEYNSTVGHGQARAQIIWTRIIYPNQQSVDLGRMVGVDKKGTSGSSGMVNNHYDKVALGLLMTSTLGVGVRMTQGKYDQNNATLGQEMGNVLAEEMARFGSRIGDKALSIKPTITVPIGERLNVFVEQDLHLEPYIQ